MARRQSDEFDPFDDELFGRDLELVDLDALRLEVDDRAFDDDEEIDEQLDPEPRPSRGRRFGRGGGSRPPKPRSTSTRTPLRIGSLILGFFQVIVYAVVALALFLGIGFGIVYAGQQLGYIPKRAASAATSSTPTAVAIVPTEAAQQPVAAPTQPPPPTATPDLGCPDAAAWWNDAQIQNAYTYFTQQALEDALGSSRIPALITQMTIRRDFVANYQMGGDPDSPCLDPLRADLLRGFDATISAARIINTDSTSANEQQANADKAYADLFDALRALGVTVAEAAATPAS